MSRELIHTITIPMYRRDYVQSEQIRPKYFERGRKNKLPMMYCNVARYKADGVREPDGIVYRWREFPVIRKNIKCMLEFLIHTETNERVIMNTDQVGVRRTATINGQKFYSGTLFRGQKDKMLGSIKDQLRLYIMTIPKINRFPLQIEVELYDTIVDIQFSNGQKWDVGNRWFPYAKCFEDVLKTGKGGCGIIPDDDRLHITKPPAVLFYPVETSQERKLVFNLYVDQRPIILNNELYKKEHGNKLG